MAGSGHPFSTIIHTWSKLCDCVVGNQNRDKIEAAVGSELMIDGKLDKGSPSSPNLKHDVPVRDSVDPVQNGISNEHDKVKNEENTSETEIKVELISEPQFAHPKTEAGLPQADHGLPDAHSVLGLEVEKHSADKCISNEGDKEKQKRSFLAKKWKRLESTEGFKINVTKKVKFEWVCAVCNLSTNCEEALKDHLRGRKHLKAKKSVNNNNNNISDSTTKDFVASPEMISNDRKQLNFVITGARKESSCALCRYNATSEEALEYHLIGTEHKLNVVALIQHHGFVGSSSVL